MKSVYCAVRTGSVNEAVCASSLKGILGGSVLTKKKSTEAVVVAGKGSGLEVNADKTKYMVMSRDQNAGQSHNIKTDNSSSERGEQFKHFGTSLANQILFRKKLSAD